MRRLLPLLFLLAFAACQSDDGAGQSISGGVYIALGDSLSQGVGASQPAVDGFVPLVHQSLGEGFQLINLGHSGDTSEELLDHGHLDEAVNEIEKRKADDDPDNDVRLVTLEIGGNDLLRLYGSLVLTGVCPDLQTSLRREQQCLQPLRQTLDAFRPNLNTALARLKQADSNLTLAAMTLYNPFSGTAIPVDELAELALEGVAETPFPAALNDVIRQLGEDNDAIVVDLYPLFEGKGNELVAGDLIHPNDAGYAVMAEAVVDALGDVR